MLSRLRFPVLQRALSRRTATMSPKTPEDLANLSILYKTGRLVPASTSATPSKSLNDRVTLYRGDITQLEVGAIVNAANNSLLGGGGVDGAIHRAAGRGLLAECRTLGGCKTGSAKITSAYDLPCEKVIHAVGPIYDDLDPETSEAELRGCYRTAMELAAASGLSSIAFSAISTGIYGYPSREAAPVAITTVKEFLEGKDGDKIGLVVFVVFEKKDLDAYSDALPLYFPPVPEGGGATKQTGSGKTPESREVDAKKEAQEEAEARTVASELPDVPKSDPDGGDHADKKAKHNG